MANSDIDKPVDAFDPREVIREEVAERRWDYRDLAVRGECSDARAKEIIDGTRLANLNLQHQDSIHDLGVYAAMLEPIL
jgi:hypothetical protein